MIMVLESAGIGRNMCENVIFCITQTCVWILVFPLTSYILLEKAMAPTPVLLPGKSYEWRSLVDCSPWGREESDTTEWLHFPFSLSCIGEGNGNPLQCSCLENPRDGGAWWAAVCGVAQSWTRLKWLSSSSSIYVKCFHSFFICMCNSIWCILYEI